MGIPFTQTKDDNSTVQNSGVKVVAEATHFPRSKDKQPKVASMTYYGVIEEIWDLSYNKFKVPLFKCKWVSQNAVEVDRQFGITTVDLQRVAISMSLSF